MLKSTRYKKEYEALVKEYRKLAKRADQRLVRIEGYRHQKGMKGIEQFAYRVAMTDIRSWSGEGARRFNVSPPLVTDNGVTDYRRSIAQLRHKIADINKFLNSATSTYKGTVEMYKKRAENLNQNKIIWGDKQGDLSWQDYYKIFQVIDSVQLDKQYDSRVILMLATVVSNVREDDIIEAKSKIDYEPDLDKVQHDVIQRLEKQGLNLKKLFK